MCAYDYQYQLSNIIYKHLEIPSLCWITRELASVEVSQPVGNRQKSKNLLIRLQEFQCWAFRMFLNYIFLVEGI